MPDEAKLPEVTPELDRLVARLFANPSVHLRNLTLSRGDGDATPEQIAAQINSALDQERRGQQEVTPAMLQASRVAWYDAGMRLHFRPDEAVFAAIYRAMHAARPLEEGPGL